MIGYIHWEISRSVILYSSVKAREPAPRLNGAFENTFPKIIRVRSTDEVLTEHRRDGRMEGINQKDWLGD